MRCYNGCPDSALQARLDEERRASKEVRKLNPNAFCTYHHGAGFGPGGWQWHEWGKEIGEMKPTYLEACASAMTALKKGDKNE